MKTNFLIVYPRASGYAQHVLLESGNRHSQQAKRDPSRGQRVLCEMDRTTFDSVSRKKGSLSCVSMMPHDAIADIDFEAYDGTRHPTAEAALQHELTNRFGVQSLDELADKLSGSRCTGATEPEPEQVSIQEAILLVKASVATKGRTPADIQRDTGLPEATVYNILSQNPNLFKIGPGGRYQKAA